ncbi:MAG: hypothetical protein K6C40_03100 [Thermoguttaceae bacterium]|nr:hypothetical protein [Thermoguttaceae bacterium]
MKKLFFCFALLFVTVLQAADGPFVRVSQENPAYFELTDGTPYIPVGLNLCCSRSMEKMELYMQKLSENGGNYARIWLSCNLWEVEPQKAGEYSEERIENVAKLLQMAEKYGIRLKFCFEHFRNIGEKKPEWCAKKIYCVDGMTKIEDFVNSETGRKYYFNRCAQFVRFKDHPNVFGWEIWNEMNCLPDFIPFTEYALPKLHAMFPNHLVMQSLGSFDHPAAFKYYPIINTMEGNDVSQIHRYLDPGAALEACKGPMDLLCADAMEILKSFKSNRPMLLAETGAVEWQHAGPSRLYALDREGLLLHDSLFVPFFCGSAGTGYIWHWDQYVEANDLWWHFGRFSHAIQGINPIQDRFEPSILEQNPVRLYVLIGQKTTMIFVRDQETNWKTELDDKIPAPTRENLILKLPCLAGKVNFYDPWTEKEEELAVNEDGTVVIPTFRRSCVLKGTTAK